LFSNFSSSQTQLRRRPKIRVAAFSLASSAAVSVGAVGKEKRPGTDRCAGR
jgi:hypothetical protein